MFASTKEVFTPTTPAEIQRYRKAHGEWIEACENELNSLSKALQRREVLPRVSVSVLNTLTSDVAAVMRETVDFDEREAAMAARLCAFVDLVLGAKSGGK